MPSRFQARELATFNTDISPGAARLYLALDEYARENGTCFPSQKELSRRLGKPIRTIQFWLAILVAKKMVFRERRKPGGTNQYRLHHAQPIAAGYRNPLRDHAQPIACLIRKNQGIEPEPLGASAERQTPTPTPEWGEADPNCGSCGGRGVVQAIQRGILVALRCECRVRRSA